MNKLIIALVLFITLNMTSIVATQNFGINQKTNVLSMPITGVDNPTYITEPGSYRLTRDMANIPIIIQSSDVCLLLNGCSLNITDTTISAGIEIANDTHDIVIQGGEISGDRTKPGIWVHGGCSNILIQNVKLSEEAQGIFCYEDSNISSNVVIRDIIVSNCITGIYVRYANSVRAYQAVITASDIDKNTPTTGIVLYETWGCTIDSCALTDLALGINATQAVATTIKDCSLDSLYGTMFTATDTIAGIRFSAGTANVINNCSINSIGGDTTGGAGSCDVYGIILQAEESSFIKNCIVNNLYPQSPYTVGTEAVYVTSCTDCVIQDNTVSNIFGNSASHSYGYDQVSTTSNFFIGNKAINCQNAAMVPYSSNIHYVLSAPSTTTYTCPPNTSHGPSGFDYNWIIS